MIAVTITGLVFAFESHVAPLTFFVLFAIACVLTTLLVEPRGLFLTVVTQPIYYVIGTMLIGWIAAAPSASAGKKTKLLTTAYPAVEHFLWLIVPFLISVVIAFFRWRRLRSSATRAYNADSAARQRRRAADESNRSSYTSVRTRSRAASRHDDADEDVADLTADERSADRSSDRYEEPEERDVPRTRTVEELIRRSEERRAARSEAQSSGYASRAEDADRAYRTESSLPRPARRYLASNKTPREDDEFRYED